MKISKFSWLTEIPLALITQKFVLCSLKIQLLIISHNPRIFSTSEFHHKFLVQSTHKVAYKYYFLLCWSAIFCKTGLIRDQKGRSKISGDTDPLIYPLIDWLIHWFSVIKKIKNTNRELIHWLINPWFSVIKKIFDNTNPLIDSLIDWSIDFQWSKNIRWYQSVD